MTAGEWISYAERQPDQRGVYEWRVPSRNVPGVVVRFFAHMRMRGNGYNPDCLSPLFDHWDGYRVTVPAGTEWREAVDPPACKEYEYKGLSVEGLELDPCPFCRRIPAVHANNTSPSGGVLVCGEPHRYNKWWLKCCGWTGSPSFKDPRELAAARHAALFPCEREAA